MVQQPHVLESLFLDEFSLKESQRKHHVKENQCIKAVSDLRLTLLSTLYPSFVNLGDGGIFKEKLEDVLVLVEIRHRIAHEIY